MTAFSFIYCKPHKTLLSLSLFCTVNRHSIFISLIHLFILSIALYSIRCFKISLCDYFLSAWITPYYLDRSETAYLFSMGQCPLTPLLPTHPILQEESPRCPNLYPWIFPLTEDTLHKEIMHRICLQRVVLPAHYTTASLNSQNLMIRSSVGSALPKVRREGHPCYHGHFHFPRLWWKPVACCLGSFSHLYLAPYSPSSQVTWPR